MSNSTTEFEIEENWKVVMNTDFKSDYFTELKSFLYLEKQEKKIFPEEKNIFKALIQLLLIR